MTRRYLALLLGVVVLAVAVILPKAEMPFEGMIVRCDPALEHRIHTDTPADDYNPPRQCHWECEFGPTFETRIKDGVQESVQTGCAGKPETVTIERQELPLRKWGFEPT